MNIDFSKGDGLVPAVIQDSVSNKVLMLAYMNRESLDKTLESGFVTFYSRSRESLWLKGETSGNYLKVVEVIPDCDQDSLLIKAIPYGPVCHTGSDTCFDEDNSMDIAFLSKLEALLKKRKEELPSDSYTSRLFIAGVKKIAQKLGEEAVEMALEAMIEDSDNFIYEAADLMYHFIVLLIERGYGMNDVVVELAGRYEKHN